LLRSSSLELEPEEIVRVSSTTWGVSKEPVLLISLVRWPDTWYSLFCGLELLAEFICFIWFARIRPKTRVTHYETIRLYVVVVKKIML